MADGDPFPAHPAAVAGQQRMPCRQRLVPVDADIGAGVRQPLLVFGHGGGRQRMAGGDPAQPVRIVAAAGGVDVQQLAGHAVYGHLAVLNATLQAALATAIAQRFPFPIVQFAEGVLLPETITQLLCLLPLDSARRFGSDIINDTIDTTNLINNTGCRVGEEIHIIMIEVSSHAIDGSHCA